MQIPLENERRNTVFTGLDVNAKQLVYIFIPNQRLDRVP